MQWETQCSTSSCGGRWADVLVLAPLSANSLAKAALGLCDNLVTCVLRAWDWQAAPVLLAPAMNTLMWSSPLTWQHLGRLLQLGAVLVPPVAKVLACGDMGMGGLAPPPCIAAAVSLVLRDRGWVLEPQAVGPSPPCSSSCPAAAQPSTHDDCPATAPPSTWSRHWVPAAAQELEGWAQQLLACLALPAQGAPLAPSPPPVPASAAFHKVDGQQGQARPAQPDAVPAAAREHGAAAATNGSGSAACLQYSGWDHTTQPGKPLLWRAAICPSPAGCDPSTEHGPDPDPDPGPDPAGRLGRRWQGAGLRWGSVWLAGLVAGVGAARLSQRGRRREGLAWQGRVGRDR